MTDGDTWIRISGIKILNRIPKLKIDVWSDNLFVILVVTILFNLFAIETILIRPRLFKTKLFKPMVHNFKLSIIPIVILVGTIVAQLLISWLGAVLKSNLVTSISLVVLVIGLIAWFLFLPNSGYLITELNLTHRDVDKVEVPIWYDIISVLSLAISGVLNTALNILLLQFLVIVYIDPQDINQINTPLFRTLTWVIFPLLSFGIYLGRYIRFNTWDLLHPRTFVKKMLDHFGISENRRDGFLFTFLYGIFLAMFYALTYLNPLLELIREGK